MTQRRIGKKVPAMMLLLFPLVSGCMYRGDGAFKQIGNSDYKVNMKLFNMFVAADGHPTPVCGIVTLEDRITPLKQAHVTLKRKSDSAVVAKGYTDHIGSYCITGILANESYLLEIESHDYTSINEIVVEPGKKNCHEVVAYKMKSEQSIGKKN